MFGSNERLPSRNRAKKLKVDFIEGCNMINRTQTKIDGKMKQRIGIIYPTVDGHTKKICKHLDGLLRQNQVKSELYAIETFNENLLDFDVLIIGASIRYGKHNKLVYNFIKEEKENLNKIRTAFFSVNLVARKENKNRPDTNPYLIKFIQEIKWKADILDVFAGKLDYKMYPFFDRLMIKLIMKITKGPTKSDVPIVYTDWQRVKEFSEKIQKDLIKHVTTEPVLVEADCKS
jgi:menaquinone-dependent protoporphyrinogen oxidase